MIQRGEIVRFKPEWSDSGDENIRFIALENEDGGRVRVAADMGLPINPQQIVAVSMLIEGVQ